MKKSAEALINYKMLIWARKTSGYTTKGIAKKLRIPVEKLKTWENGEKRPTIKQLRRLANYYKRPLALFYLSKKPEEDIPTLHDFRRIQILEEYKEPVKLKLEIRRAIYRREIALELSKELNIKPTQFNHRISINDDPEAVGEKIRRILGIDIELQLKWRNSYEAFDRWRIAVENAGVLVFQAARLDIAEMRGFNVSKFPLPIIGINSKDTINGKIFTVFHEISHIMLKESSICDMREGYKRRVADERKEIFCNHIAGATLIPKQTLLNEPIVKKNKPKSLWTNNQLEEISNRYKTSKEVVLRRLLILGRTTNEFYQEKREEFLANYRRIEESRKDKRRGGPKFFVKVVSRNGLSFINLVLDGYYQKKITSSDVADYLQTKLKHLPDIETLTMKKSLKFGPTI